MTQEEVNALHEYLHQNYKYKSGQLIAKKDIKHSKRAGDALGGFFYQGTGGSPKIRASINLNGKKYRMTLGHFIWIYHHKEYKKYIHHKDLNPVNTKIGNLVPASLTAFQEMRVNKCKGYKAKKNKDGSTSYRVIIEYNYKKINIGSFDSEKKAANIYQKARALVCAGVVDEKTLKEKLSTIFPSDNFRKAGSKFGRGVYQNHKRFVARTRIDKKTYIIGNFDTPEEARDAYLRFKKELSNDTGRN